jgi:adhesin HecA-like repeat protein
MGHNNQVVSGNATAWAPTDPAFIVGTGTGPAAGGQATALAIYNNGNVVLGGPATLANPNGTLQVNGSAALNGQATFFGSVILTHPHGDISPGIYSH